ncbi:MAG: pyridoxal-phosphate dependent enzyme [Saprospiraceae bacterium]|nr:pyridoxal-phosphate dependent enzyme [Saprospiraceae bacterium]
MTVFETYRNHLSLDGLQHFISIGEGNTPLVRSNRIGIELGLSNLYFKLEHLNPSGSYKDRFASLAVSQLKAHNADVCLATSSGNTGAALAAYAAVAGIPCHIAIVDGAPIGKLRQMQEYGAKLWMVKDFGKDASKTQAVINDLENLATSCNSLVQISAFKYSPFGMQGVQTIAYEIMDQLPSVAHVFSPAGGGGLTLALTKGFRVFDEGPSIHCVQPFGNNTISGPLREGFEKAQRIESSTTQISGLQVPSVIDGDAVVRECRHTGGNGSLVNDQEVYFWQQQMITKEGIYCEPAGAVAMAGLKYALDKGEIHPNQSIVCLVTGHGFKDVKSMEKHLTNNPIGYISDIYELKKFLHEKN